MEANCPILEVLEAVRPHLELTFENILAHINTIYVLKTKQGAMGRHERYLRLKVSIYSINYYVKLWICKFKTEFYKNTKIKSTLFI